MFCLFCGLNWFCLFRLFCLRCLFCLRDLRLFVVFVLLGMFVCYVGMFVSFVLREMHVLFLFVCSAYVACLA